jgi:hypothetical protein
VALAWFSFGTAQARTITFDFVGDEPCAECPAGYATAKFVFETKRALHTTFWWSLFDITRGEVQSDLEPTREYWKGMKYGDFNGFSLFDPSVTAHDLTIEMFSKYGDRKGGVYTNGWSFKAVSGGDYFLATAKPSSALGRTNGNLSIFRDGVEYSTSGKWTFDLTTIPLPASAWFLAGALAGLAGLRRRVSR